MVLCHSVACTLLVKLFWEPAVHHNFCVTNMNIESQYFTYVWGGNCILFQVNWDWSAVLFGETNQKKMTRMVHSFFFHPALNMLPHHPSLASMSKCFVWQGSAYHQNGCNWVLVCAYTHAHVLIFIESSQVVQRWLIIWGQSSCGGSKCNYD